MESVLPVTVISEKPPCLHLNPWLFSSDFLPPALLWSGSGHVVASQGQPCRQAYSLPVMQRTRELLHFHVCPRTSQDPSENYSITETSAGESEGKQDVGSIRVNGNSAKWKVHTLYVDVQLCTCSIIAIYIMHTCSLQIHIYINSWPFFTASVRVSDNQNSPQMLGLLRVLGLLTVWLWQTHQIYA